ncbi:hypothetical protein [Rhodospirillaceae bacterium SYSU D60014]|uniref:hypothetical protein n=1 Tax=Virgifigura deserti TaxID=2268457 RepID=UPI000E6700A4
MSYPPKPPGGTATRTRTGNSRSAIIRPLVERRLFLSPSLPIEPDRRAPRAASAALETARDEADRERVAQAPGEVLGIEPDLAAPAASARDPQPQPPLRGGDTL